MKNEKYKNALRGDDHDNNKQYTANNGKYFRKRF